MNFFQSNFFFFFFLHRQFEYLRGVASIYKQENGMIVAYINREILCG